MTIIFQIAAIVVIAVVAVFVLRSGGARHQAIRRILLLLFIAAAGSSVFFPQVWTFLANLVGIGRGTDLILYITVLVFLGFVATTYRRFRSIENDLTELSRQLAITRADPPPGASRDDAGSNPS